MTEKQRATLKADGTFEPWPTPPVCPRFGKLFGGCKFEGRYDLSAPAQVIEEFKGSSAAMVGIIEATKSKTYVRDVCVSCGKTVERQK